MNLPDLTIRPTIQRPTLRLKRLGERDLFRVLSAAPAFLASHWRNSRSYPCTERLIGSCPWCDANAKRDHAYLGARFTPHASPPFTCIVELPPGPLLIAMEQTNVTSLLDLLADCSRRAKKASPQIILRNIEAPCARYLPAVTPQEITRTLCKVYGLPDPDGFNDTAAWIAATRFRVHAAGYSPASHQPPAE